MPPRKRRSGEEGDVVAAFSAAVNWRRTRADRRVRAARLQDRQPERTSIMNDVLTIPTPGRTRSGHSLIAAAARD